MISIFFGQVEAQLDAYLAGATAVLTHQLFCFLVETNNRTMQVAKSISSTPVVCPALSSGLIVRETLVRGTRV